MGRNFRGNVYRFCIPLMCLTFLWHAAASGKLQNFSVGSESDSQKSTGGIPTHLHINNHVDVELTLSTGIRNDDLEWSISGNGVNILSELTWSNVESYQFCVEKRIQFENKIYFRSGFSFSTIINGDVRDSDYGQNGRAVEWSRSMSESTGDELWDLSVGGGYSFHFLNKRLTVSPLLGLSYHKQNLRIQKGNQVLSNTSPFGGNNPPAVGPLSSQLNSTYFARWAGPWIGCDLKYRPRMQPPVYHGMELRLSVELHRADYLAEGNWNLRGDLKHPKSFTHRADGFGISITGQWFIHLSSQWDIRIAASHQSWSTNSGTDRKFLAIGGTSTTKLNEVNWSSTSYMVGSVFHFK